MKRTDVVVHAFTTADFAISWSKASGAKAMRLHLPDPSGTFRLFKSDPGWNETWWWLGLPLA